jgi:7-cyano-7-deazaguanine tRNA-ribosyltransferase
VFEVHETDLAGRTGRLKVGGKIVDTPAFLPVIHPFPGRNEIEEIKRMGFQAVMTNAYIAMKSYPEISDIHSATGFDGVIMTDSGGYQVLEYGEVDAEPLEIAKFEKRICSDIAVILDRPTGFPATRRRAEMSVNDTLRAAKKSLELVSSKPPLWGGPIQGGMHLDLVKRSARAISGFPFDLFAIGSPVELMNGYRFVELVRLVTEAKSALPPDKPVHLFGAGHPFTLALAVALGCDMFDSASYVLFAKEGKYMTQQGVRILGELQEFTCVCPVCSSLSPREMLGLPREERVQRLALHNLYVMKQELQMTRQALRERRLWNYLTYRMRSHPELASALRFEDGTLRLFDEGSSLDKKKAIFFFDDTDLQSPEVRRHRYRLLRSYRRRRDVLLLTIGFDRVGASLPNSRRLLEDGESLGADAAIFHPFLSVVPVACFNIYPLTQNVCVRLPPESVIRDSARFLAFFARSRGYRKVLLNDLLSEERLRNLIREELRSQKLQVRIVSRNSGLRVH